MFFDKSTTNENKIKTHSFVKLRPQRNQSKQISQTGILLPDSENRDESTCHYSTDIVWMFDNWPIRDN